MTTIEQRYQSVCQHINELAEKYQRDANDIKLLAVSKTKPYQDIETLYHIGQTAFAENYLQEAQQKIIQLKHLAIEWHYIGGIQSNKTATIAQLFDWVHSVASLKHAKRLNMQRPNNKKPLNICIQINSSGELSKDGIHPDELSDFAQKLVQLPRLRLRGLMTLPAKTATLEDQRKPFNLLQTLAKQLNHDGLPIDTLSMGMSLDMEAAIAEQSTLLRIGTAIFGQRQ